MNLSPVRRHHPALLFLIFISVLASLAPGADFNVTTTADSGPGSLRQAILDSNAAPGADTIRFAIIGAGAAPSIKLTGSLPEITGTLTMDGASQSGASLIELKSSDMPAGDSLLTLNAGGCVIKNLRLLSTAADVILLTLHSGNGNTVEGLSVGVTTISATLPSIRHGVVVESDDNVLRNLLVGGIIEGDCIRITGSRNTLLRSDIGTVQSSPQGSQTGMGIHLAGGSDNIIGSAGKASPSVLVIGDRGEMNVIQSNRSGGIHVEGGTGHRIRANVLSMNGSYSFPANRLTGASLKINGGARNIEVDGTAFKSGEGSHISVQESASSVRIANCSSLGGMDGVFIGGGVHDVTVEDCLFDRASPGARQGAGIWMEGGSSVSGPILIRNNTIVYCRIGVLVKNGMGEVTIGTRRDAASPVSNIITSNAEGAVVVRDPMAKVRIAENNLNSFFSWGSSGPPVNLQPDGEADRLETPNDFLDSDSGPNGLQNKPELNFLIRQPGGLLELRGTLNSQPLKTYRIEALGSSVSQTSDGGFLGASSVTTDASGNAEFSFTATGCETGWMVNLTATSPDGETSEYGSGLICPAPTADFPELVNQSSLSLAEKDSASGSVFSILRLPGTSSAYEIYLRLSADFVRDASNPTPRSPLRWRLNPSDPWTNLDWEAAARVSFGVNDEQRAIYLSAQDDNSWDPQNKPGKLVLDFQTSQKVVIPVQFPDNDSPPVFTIKSAVPGRDNLQEAGGSHICQLSQDRPVTVPMTYSISVNAAESTAVPGQDFTFDQTVLTMTESQVLSGTALNFITINDLLVEGDELVAVNIRSTTPGVEYSSVAKIILQDNDFCEVSIANSSIPEGNAGNTVLNFPVSLSAQLMAPLTLDWTTVANGTATAGSDYTAASGTVTIPAGSTAGNISVAVAGDTVLEPDETFSVRISPPSGASVTILKAEAEGTILNDDQPSVSITGASVPESSGNHTMTATLSQAAPFSCSVSYTLSNGTAVRVSDFTGPYTGTLNFPAGATTASFSIGIVDDSVVEPDETFTVQLSTPVNLSIGTGSAAITILNNDVPALLKPAGQTVTEGDSGAMTVAVPLKLSGAGNTGASVDWQVTPDSAAAQPAAGTAIFAPGTTEAVVNILIPGNLTPQPARQVSLAFSNPVNLTLPSSPATVIMVLDNDQRTVGGTGFSASEGDSDSAPRMFRLTMTGGVLDVPVTVEYQTQDDTAKAGSDYTAAGGTATIPAGATETLIPVSITGDGRYEANESFTLTLRNPVNAQLDGARIIGTILNDDSQPGVSVDPVVVTAAPTGGPFLAWLEVKLKGASGSGSESSDLPVSFKVSTRDGTALAGKHYTALNGGALTFQPGRSIEWIAIPVSELTGAMEPCEFLVDFQPADASGGGTAVTAGVTVEPLRVMTFEPLLSGWFYLQFPTGKGQNYLIQEAQSLAGPWVDNSSILQGSGSPVFQAVISTKPRAYFRVRAFNSPPSTPAALTP